MPLCGFDKKMLKGLTLFAQSLYEAALRKSEKSGISIEEAMEVEIAEMNEFLFALDKKYEEFREISDVPESMRKLVSYVESKG